MRWHSTNGFSYLVAEKSDELRHDILKLPFHAAGYSSNFKTDKVTHVHFVRTRSKQHHVLSRRHGDFHAMIVNVNEATLLCCASDQKLATIPWGDDIDGHKIPGNVADAFYTLPGTAHVVTTIDAWLAGGIELAATTLQAILNFAEVAASSMPSK